MKIVLCTQNQGKVKEIREFLSGIPVEILSLRDVSFGEEIVEDGTTFYENALRKSSAVYERTGMPSLADDSGLCVDALGGAPGVISAIYAGKPSNSKANNRKLFNELKGVTRREARFVCCIVFVFPSSLLREGFSCETKEYRIIMEGDRAIFSCIGTAEGYITEEPRGDKGFGYDPIFFYPPLGKTFGEMNLCEKNSVSHRGKAIKIFREFLQNFILSG